MATVADVPHLVAALAKSFAVIEGQQYSAQVVQRLTSVAHDILLGLNEAQVLDVEEHMRSSFNEQRREQVIHRAQEKTPTDSWRLQTLLSNLNSISKVPSPSFMLAADDAPNQYETLHFTEHQALLSLLFHTEGSVPRKGPPANDLFIPNHMPFDLTAPHPPSQISAQQLQQTPHSSPHISSSQVGAPLMGWQNPPLMGWQSPQAEHELDARVGAEFKLLPSSVFEQLSDPNRLNGVSSGGQANSSGLEKGSVELTHGRLAWGTDENGFNSQLERMQQKPLWQPTGPDSKAQDVLPHRANGGMPYSLPMALLQMDAEPGSLTSFSRKPWDQGPFEDADLRLAHSSSRVPPQPGSAPPHTALPPLRQTLAPAHSTQASSQQTLAPMQSSLAQPRLPTEPVRQGSDSLRSSDEFPANKENSHGQWPPLERRAAPVAKAVATAGSGAHAAGVVSEQVLAQEAVYALQGVGSSIVQLKEGKLRTATVQASSLASILRPVLQSGERRQALEAFVAAFGVEASSSPATSNGRADPVLQAFAAAVQTVLRWHTSALNQLPAAVKQRRQAEHGMQGKAKDSGTGGHHLVPPLTVLEVVLHTQHLQAQLLALSHLCSSEPNTESLPLRGLPADKQLTLTAEVNLSNPASNGTKHDAQTGAFPSCQWAVQGFPKGPALLSYLYAELAEAESHAAPLVRFLFISAFRPYMRHIRSWMYSTAEVDVAFADVQAFDDNSLAQLPDSTMGLLPQALPHFLQPYSQHFILAGRQLRILSQMQSNCKLFVSQIGAIASSEGSEASLLLPNAPGPFEDCMPSWGLSKPATLGFLPSALHAFPLVFGSQALRQVGVVRGKASEERLYEADRLLTNLAEQRQMADDAMTAQVLLRKQQLHDSREAVRAQKAEESRQRRLHRARLLNQQQAAMSAQQSRLEAERAAQIRQEQEVLEFGARQEHKAALAAVAAASKAAKQDLQLMHQSQQHLAWRTQRWHIAHLRRPAIETAEAAEDAELQILLSNPALRQPLAPAAPPERDTLKTISGFQGFQEAIPADSAHLAVPVHVESATRVSERGPQAATSMTDDADMTDTAGFSWAAESSARAGDAVGVARRARGTWGAPKQPFIAAGRHTRTNETAAQLLSSGASPTAVAPSSNRDATAVAEAQPQIAAGLVESTRHELAAAGSAVATCLSDSELPHSSTNPEDTTPVINVNPAATSPRQQPVDAEQAQEQQAQQQRTQQAQPAQQQQAQHAPQQQHTQQQHAQQDQQQQAQQAVATAEHGGQMIHKPAAGSYRRVAWAPVQSPFPAAGSPSAGSSSAGATSAGIVASGATAEAVAAPASVSLSCIDADQDADSTQGLRPEHASDCTESDQALDADSTQGLRPEHASNCTESEQAAEPAQYLAQQLESGSNQEPDLTHAVAQDLDCTQGASGSQSVEAAAAAAADDDAAAAAQFPATDQEESSQPGVTGRKGRGVWKGVAQPFVAAGVSSSFAAAEDTGAAATADRDSFEVSRLEATATLPMPRNRRRWNLEQATDSTAKSASLGYQGNMEHQPYALGQGQDEEGLVPLSVVMDACLAQGILDQYRCASKACLGMFLDELKVMDLLRAFQQYFFMAAGDWAENLTEALCACIAQRSTLHEHSVQSMVDSSLKGTSVELDSNAANLKAALQVPSKQMPVASRTFAQQTAVVSRASQTSGAAPSSSADSDCTPAAVKAPAGDAAQQLPGSCQASVTIDSSQLKALDAVQLSFDVQWPLSLIVTQEAVQQYNAVFSWLLCLKRVSLLMRNLWLDLAACARWSNQASLNSCDAKGASIGDAVLQKLRTLQLFRHEAAHLVAALQAYMQGQLLGTCWHELQSAVMNQVTDLAELQHAHMQYLAQTQHQCLMSQSTREVRAIIEPVLQCIMDFTNSCRSSDNTVNDMQELLQNEGRWSPVHKSIQEFQLRTSVLYKVLKYANGRGHYQELFVQLDFNKYYANC